MSVLVELIRKELVLLMRDAHALALLFLMPAFFILLMSLALRDVFRPGRGKAIAYYLVDEDTTGGSERLAAAVRSRGEFRDLGRGTEESRALALRSGEASFVMVIPRGFTSHMTDSAGTLPVDVLAGPTISAPIVGVFAAAVREAVVGVYVPARISAATGHRADALLGSNVVSLKDVNRLVQDRVLGSTEASSVRPTSVQQNVPAWLVFAMFFVALPLSTTWLQERTQGTLTRLRSMGVSPATLLLGKLIPYLLVNGVQVVLMLGVGVWAVPALGGDRLTLGHSPAGLAVIALAVGVAAVSYGLLIANLVTSTEQATIATGATNLLLGALGGVMVPRSIMPPGLQRLSYGSPMAWGLEGFQDIVLRGGGIHMIATKVYLLFGFSVVALGLAAVRLRRAGGGGS